MPKLNLSLWNSKNLLIMIACGQGAALMYSSISLDGTKDVTNPIFWFAAIRGTLGIASSFCTSYAAYEGAHLRAKKAQQLCYGALAFLIVCSVVVISTCTYGTPTDGWRVLAATAYALLPEAGAVAVAAAGGRLFSADQQPANAGATGEQPVEQGAAVGQRRPGKRQRQVEQPAPMAYQSPMAKAAECPYCHEVKTQGWVNGHKSKCSQNPANQPIPVNMER